MTTKWTYEYFAFGMRNHQTVWITKAKPHRPIRYEMIGYDMMLGSYYDHYVINYITFEKWDGKDEIFNLPTCNVSLFVFRLKFRNISRIKNSLEINKKSLKIRISRDFWNSIDALENFFKIHIELFTLLKYHRTFCPGMLS